MRLEKQQQTQLQRSIKIAYERYKNIDYNYFKFEIIKQLSAHRNNHWNFKEKENLSKLP